MLEQQYVVVTLLRDVLDRGLQVAIGTETGMAPLAECALIVAPVPGRWRARGDDRRAGAEPDGLSAGHGGRGRRQPPPLATAHRGLTWPLTTTSCSRCRATPAATRSSVPIDGSPGSTTRTRTPIPPPRRGSRRSRWPTRCCPTRTSGSATTGSVPMASARATGSRAAASTTSSTPSSVGTAPSAGEGGGARWGRPAAPTSRWWPTSRSRRRCSARGTPSTCAPRSRASRAAPRAPSPAPSPSPASSAPASGQVQRVRQSFLGQMVTNSVCPRCNGQGRVISDPCQTCGGEGRTIEERTYTVDIPGGVDTGSTLRLTDRGAAGPRGGPNGDLYVHVRVQPHERFTRDGVDLHCDLPLSFAQAALGAHLEFDTLDGQEDLVVPRGTPSGKEFKLKGRGVPHLERRHRGDLIVRGPRRRPHGPHRGGGGPAPAVRRAAG